MPHKPYHLARLAPQLLLHHSIDKRNTPDTLSLPTFLSLVRETRNMHYICLCVITHIPPIQTIKTHNIFLLFVYPRSLQSPFCMFLIQEINKKKKEIRKIKLIHSKNLLRIDGL